MDLTDGPAWDSGAGPLTEPEMDALLEVAAYDCRGAHLNAADQYWTMFERPIYSERWSTLGDLKFIEAKRQGRG